jgi:hypothetical protein
VVHHIYVSGWLDRRKPWEFALIHWAVTTVSMLAAISGVAFLQDGPIRHSLLITAVGVSVLNIVASVAVTAVRYRYRRRLRT